MARLPATTPGLAVGLFGGSFDPPHRGHLTAAGLALRRLGLDRVWWLVTPGNPLKDTGGLAPLAERMAAVRALCEDPRMVATDAETRLGTRYTIDLVRRLVRLRPGVRFVLVVGADNWATMHRWGHWREICRLVPIAVVDRPGATFAALSSPAARAFAGARLRGGDGRRLPGCRPPAWILLTGRRVALSSTAVRAAHGRAAANPAENTRAT
ncbi:nicotinate-nucleotide adenylyltransferase [Methylobrevis albus]|uniref:Probable nicotinate-nucleotide adenylyltransferase n=1 Tax=Methylobrevis albus TaxID=2793297 RepID=A0A931I372_9HYPH|nr:nicotinate-nucleotide adenylyltransferase [Methylobrevis albus]MBH0238071.1 nicotinate-nucleotide adenylyltransferase [Methylobrevis albus]